MCLKVSLMYVCMHCKAQNQLLLTQLCSSCSQHTMDQMLQRAGVPHELADSDLQGPTEVHLLGIMAWHSCHD